MRPPAQLIAENQPWSRAVGFLARHNAFFARWAEISVGCSRNGLCPFCIGGAALGVTVEAGLEKFGGETKSPETVIPED